MIRSASSVVQIAPTGSEHLLPVRGSVTEVPAVDGVAELHERNANLRDRRRAVRRARAARLALYRLNVVRE